MVARSILYDRDGYVSSEAIMFNRGGWDNMMNWCTNHDSYFDVEPGDSSDDDGEDDDNDDNDGHSSMLSTASLHLRKRTTRKEKFRCRFGSGHTTSKTYDGTYTNKAVRLNHAT